MSEDQIAQIRAAHQSARPNPVVNPAWANAEHDIGVLLATITTLDRQLEEARALVTEANNSLYGSQGYFHSLSGGDFDKYHLATGIEELKSRSRSEWRRAEAAERQLATAREALENIRELNFSGADENGNQWANSDLIDQEIIAALSRMEIQR